MKKRIRVIGLGVCLIAVGFVLLTVRDAGKKETPGLGYHSAEQWDVFENGSFEETFEEAPLSEDFLDFDGHSEDALGHYRARIIGQDHGLGLIPSPIAQEIHQAVRAKTLYPSVYDDRYDLRDPDGDGDRSDSLVPQAREQWACGACWTFASLGAIEGVDLSRLGYGVDFSENHPLFNSGYDWGGCSGGNVDMMLGYLSRNAGPVFESDDPFQLDTSPGCGNCLPRRYIDAGFKLQIRSSVSDILFIKQALLEYGPLYAAMGWYDAAYRPSDYSYISKASINNHAVAIVGWDDEKKVEGALSDGAFICRNSWGEDWGEKGYFYVSYEDKNLGFSTLAAFVDEPDALLDFDRIYYHDPLGMTSSTGFGQTWAWGACAFKTHADCDLVAVGLFTTAFESRYTIYIYGSLQNDRLEGLIAGPFSGSLTGKGYHTIRLDDGIVMDEDETFVIAVKFETPEGTWPVPLERPFTDYSSLADAGPGESYLSTDGSIWKDTLSVFADSSVCIKAFVREKDCDETALEVHGTGHSADFRIRNKDGSLIMAVVTDGCGHAATDAEVIATFINGDPDNVLYDDGDHADILADDGIYANRYDEGDLDSSSINVRAIRDDQVIYKTGEARLEEGGESPGGKGGGCFIVSIQTLNDQL